MTGKKLGRPTDNPKPIKLSVRIDEETLKILDDYCKRKKITQPEGIRNAIKDLKKQIKKEAAHPRKRNTTSHLQTT